MYLIACILRSSCKRINSLERKSNKSPTDSPSICETTSFTHDSCQIQKLTTLNKSLKKMVELYSVDCKRSIWLGILLPKFLVPRFFVAKILLFQTFLKPAKLCFFIFLQYCSHTLNLCN